MTDDAELLYEHIARGEGTTETQLRAAYRHWGDDRLAAAIGYLVKAELVRVYQTRRRPATYVVNPAVGWPE
jgi:hypothetical protein